MKPPGPVTIEIVRALALHEPTTVAGVASAAGRTERLTHETIKRARLRGFVEVVVPHRSGGYHGTDPAWWATTLSGRAMLRMVPE